MYRVGMYTSKIYDENYPLDRIEECCNCYDGFEKAVEASAEGQCKVCKGCKGCPESRKE